MCSGRGGRWGARGARGARTRGAKSRTTSWWAWRPRTPRGTRCWGGPGSPVPVTGNSSQFGAVIAEFDGNYNGVLGALVNYQASNPARLYVSRVNAAINFVDSTHTEAQFGIGGIDSHGSVHFRADNNV